VLSLVTTGSNDPNDPVAITTSGAIATAVKLADFDGDGHLDLLINYAGNGSNCQGSDDTVNCTLAGNEFQIVWGSATGLTNQSTEVPVVTGTGNQNDAVALRIDASATPELLVTTTLGLYAYDLQSDRSYVPRSAPLLVYEFGTSPTTTIFGFGTTLATGDVNDDGLPDLLLNDDGTMHVLLSVPATMTSPQ
jgi:hypothetical protein